jgi:predicted metal-dependent phosphoesterase TrpH
VPDVWSKADLHIHTRHSDGLASVPEVLEYASTRTDLRVVAITDHNTLEGALFAKSIEDLYPGVEVVVGEEITSRWGHILGLFLTEEVPPGLSAAETIARIEDQGGIAIVAHPFANRAFGPFGLKSLGNRVSEVAFHAMEVYNSSPYLVLANRTAAKAFAGGQGWAATGGSDAHVLRAVGKGCTLFRGETAEDLRRSLIDLETTAVAGRGGMSIAIRYFLRYPQIRRQQSLNRVRCRVRV